MPDYVTLMGAEEVARAGRNMQDAAQTMRSAAGSMDDTVRQQAILFDSFLMAFTALVERMEAAVKEKKDG